MSLFPVLLHSWVWELQVQFQANLNWPDLTTYMCNHLYCSPEDMEKSHPGQFISQLFWLLFNLVWVPVLSDGQTYSYPQIYSIYFANQRSTHHQVGIGYMFLSCRLPFLILIASNACITISNLIPSYLLHHLQHY
jgi:hypothetical protein